MALSDIFAYIAVFGFFAIFLYYLIKLAEKTIYKEYPSQIQDDFMKINGYSYDFVLVYQVHEESGFKLTLDQTQFSLRSVIEKLTKAQLECEYFYSCQRDEIYIKIRASPEKLKKEANRIDYKLLLDPLRYSYISSTV